MSPKGEGRFIPHEAWGEEDPEKHAKLEPEKFNLSLRTKKALRTGRGHLGKDIRGGVTDKEAQARMREARAAEQQMIKRIDQGDREEIELPDEVEEMLRVFNALPENIREEIIGQVESRGTPEEKFAVIKDWVSRLKTEGVKFESEMEKKPKAFTEATFPDLTEEEWAEIALARLDQPVLSPFRNTNFDLDIRKGRYHRGRSRDSHGKRGRKPGTMKGGPRITDLEDALEIARRYDVEEYHDRGMPYEPEARAGV